MLHDIGIKMDQLGKRIHTNFVGGNSDYWSKFSCSSNFKDMCKTLPYCEECKNKLTQILDNVS